MAKYLITGGAGFIGSNAAKKFITGGHDVVIFDNLSRAGVERNLEWLKSFGQFTFVKGDVRNFEELNRLFSEHRFDAVLHLAAQVAVTSSVINPREDFESNSLGAFNLLEAVRISGQNPAIIYSSTNKVYGGMEKENIKFNGDKYEFADHQEGIREDYPLDFHSPYGCSKGAADQYFRDYARIFNLRTVVFRQSCIYGYRQFGKEDQGWVAWFIIAAMTGQPMTIYGDGFQVRDILFVDDLVGAYEAAIKNINKAAGQVYNIGGGMKNALSLRKFIELLERKMEMKFNLGRGEMRIGDQKIFVSDNFKAKLDLGWEPAIGYEEGIEILFNWVKDNLHYFKKIDQSFPVFKRYLITGGAGFIGTNLVKELLAKGHEVVVFDNYAGGKKEDRVQKGAFYVEGDVKNLEELNRVCRRGFDGIYHLAALPRVTFSVEHPAETHAANVDGTLNVLIAARDNKIKRVVFSSSSSVYGNQEKYPAKEDFVALPISPYALHKFIGEHYCRLFSELYGVETVSLRYFNVYGPYFDPDGAYALVIGKFLKQKKDGQPMTVCGDGEYFRDYTHVSDVVRANILAMEGGTAGRGEVINIGNGNPRSVNEIVKMIGGEFVFVSPRPGDVRRTHADNSKAKELLEWEPTISLEDGIRRLKETYL